MESFEQAKQDQDNDKPKIPDYTFVENNEFKNISEVNYLSRVDDMKNNPTITRKLKDNGFD